MAAAVEVTRQVPGGPSDTVIRGTARLVFAQLKRPRATLAVTFVSDATMRSLNRRTRGKDKTTDVLAFPAEEKGTPAFPSTSGEPAGFLGDVVISLPEARRQAKERALPETYVVCELLIHGILHCAGYDHVKAADAKKMFSLQNRLLTKAHAAYVA